jgi:hypothetical protein
MARSQASETSGELTAPGRAPAAAVGRGVRARQGAPLGRLSGR